ncbi:MAG: alpha/beta hydrolase [Candidatus Eremiobacteraeota bacterium]|nr:alpha/beta hydrolase [Candidatus Eremiobacteraeota bacterium]
MSAFDNAAPAFGAYTYDELVKQYDASSTVPSTDPYFAEYAARSERSRTELACELDVVYGSHERERVDFFPALQPDSPLFFFVHGGYWRRLDKSFFSFVATTVVRAGGAAAIVNYPLAPTATLDQIVSSVRNAFAFTLGNAARLNADARRVVAGGHSAGGQLTGMIAATDWSAYGVPADCLTGIFPISGLFDLHPVRLSHVNEWMAMDEAVAERNSAQRLIPKRNIRLIASVGGAESDEFRRQSLEYVHAWEAAGHSATYLAPPGHNHFSIPLALADATTPLAREMLKLLELS